jgi:hypothetical protein
VPIFQCVYKRVDINRLHADGFSIYPPECFDKTTTSKIGSKGGTKYINFLYFDAYREKCIAHGTDEEFIKPSGPHYLLKRRYIAVREWKMRK